MIARVFPAATPRVECGPIQFGDDWPGTFIRGDVSAYYAMGLRQFLEMLEKDAAFANCAMAMLALRGLLAELEGSRV